VQAVNDLAEGRLQVYSSSYAIQRPQQQAGRIKVLVQMGGKRAPSLPDIPTATEAGFPAMEMDGLVGLFGSPAVSAELREKIVAANDDHTLLFTPSGSFTVHPFQYEKLPYAPEDLVPIARLSNTIMAVGVPESAGITTLAEFVARARAEPGKFNFAAVPGIGE